MNFEDKYNSFDYYNEQIRNEKKRESRPNKVYMGELERDESGNYYAPQLAGG